MFPQLEKSKNVFASDCAVDFISCKNKLSEERSQLQSRYGNEILEMVWKLEKFDFKLSKTELDTKFPCKCKNNDIIPIF